MGTRSSAELRELCEPLLLGFSLRRGLPRLLGQVLYLLEPLLELLGRIRVSERPRQVFHVLFVGTHENERLFEGHVLESGQRQSCHFPGVLHLGFLTHSVHTSRLDEKFLVLLRIGSAALSVVYHLSPSPEGTLIPCCA